MREIANILGFIVLLAVAVYLCSCGDPGDYNAARWDCGKDPTKWAKKEDIDNPCPPLDVTPTATATSEEIRAGDCRVIGSYDDEGTFFPKSIECDPEVLVRGKR